MITCSTNPTSYNVISIYLETFSLNGKKEEGNDICYLKTSIFYKHLLFNLLENAK